MLFKITVNKIAGTGYFPRQLIAQGFHGELNLVVGPLAAIMIKPGTTKEKAIESLELTIAALKLSEGEGWEPAQAEPVEAPTS